MSRELRRAARLLLAVGMLVGVIGGLAPLDRVSAQTTPLSVPVDQYGMPRQGLLPGDWT